MLQSFKIYIAKNHGIFATYFLLKNIEANSLAEAKQVAESIVAEHPNLNLYVHRVVKLEKLGA